MSSPRFIPHPDKAKADDLLHCLRQYQEVASAHGIEDIFQDNGGKILQMLLALGLQCTGRRIGNDARDASGNEYELKTLNVRKRKSFTTHHHLKSKIIAKYRSVGWLFAIYEGIELRRIYYLQPNQLEPFFLSWEHRLTGSADRDHLNNPKIDGAYVVTHGMLVFDIAPEGFVFPPPLRKPVRRERGGAQPPDMSQSPG